MTTSAIYFTAKYGFLAKILTDYSLSFAVEYSGSVWTKTMALTPNENHIYVGSWTSSDDTGLDIFDASDGTYLSAYSNPSTDYFYYMEIQDTRALLIHWRGWFTLFNTTSRSVITSGELNSSNFIIDGQLLDLDHFVLSTENGHLMKVNNSRTIVWKQQHSYMTYTTL